MKVNNYQERFCVDKENLYYMVQKMTVSKKIIL